MFDFLLESLRFIVLLFIVIFLKRFATKKLDKTNTGWKLIETGFLLLLFGSLLDITDNFDSLNRYIIIGDTQVEAFFEKIVGFLGGFVLLALGLYRWIPSIRLLNVEREDHKTIESALELTEYRFRASEDRYRGIFNESVATIYVFDQDKNFIDSNQAGLDLLGYSREELLNMSIADVDADQGAVVPAHKHLLSGGQIVNFEHRLVHKDGHIITVLNNSRPLTDPKGEVIGMQSTLIDITERTQAEIALNAAMASQQAILAALPDIMFEMDEDGRYLQIWSRNPDELAQSKENLLGHTISEMLPADAAGQGMAALKEAAENGSSQGQKIQLTTPVGVQWFELSTSHIANSVSPKRFIVLSRNISERKKSEDEKARLQRELQQVHKMESLGHLTGGIAHDFNNLLNIMSGFTELLLNSNTIIDDLKLSGYLNHLKNATQRATSLVSQMLSFSRVNQADSLAMEITPVLKEEVEMLRATLPTTIELNTEIEDKLPAILMNPTQLQQMVMNLCVNARDAMDGEGKLGIRLGWARDLDTESSVSHKPITGDWIELAITDTGSGIAPELIEEIFTPFFTTKEVGKGTGMGLSVVYGIMENHGGHILVESEPGKGTNLCLLFPPITEEVSLTADADNVAEPVKGNNENILIVDDEESIAILMQEILTDYGYQTTITTDSTEALSLFKTNPDKFAMLITDQTMPKLTGLQLITQIREIKPNLPVILCSGFSDKINGEEAEIKNIHYFNKPVEFGKLNKKVASLLNTD